MVSFAASAGVPSLPPLHVEEKQRYRLVGLSRALLGGVEDDRRAASFSFCKGGRGQGLIQGSDALPGRRRTLTSTGVQTKTRDKRKKRPTQAVFSSLRTDSTYSTSPPSTFERIHEASLPERRLDPLTATDLLKRQFRRRRSSTFLRFSFCTSTFF
jgi:hypothetical protein